MIWAGYSGYQHFGLPGGDFLSSVPAAATASGEAEVWLFTTPNRGQPCSDAKASLTRRGVNFKQWIVDPSIEDDAYAEWKSFNEPGLPLIAAGNQNTVGHYEPDIASLLGSVFGDTYLTRTEKAIFRNHFNSDGSPRIVLYGTDWCPVCAKLRKNLREENMPFYDVDVEKPSPKIRLMEVMGINGYPATWVGYARVHGTGISSVKKTMHLVRRNSSL